MIIKRRFYIYEYNIVAKSIYKYLLRITPN